VVKHVIAHVNATAVIECLLFRFRKVLSRYIDVMA